MEFLQAHDLARLTQGQRVKKDSVHHTEDGCVRANSNGQRNHGHGGEAGGLPQHAKLVAQILKQSLHVCVARAPSPAWSG